MAGTLSSSEGTTAQEVVEKARKRERALHPAAVHLQRSVDALSNLVGNLKEEQTRQRWISRQRQEIDELKKSIARFNETLRIDGKVRLIFTMYRF